MPSINLGSAKNQASHIIVLRRMSNHGGPREKLLHKYCDRPAARALWRSTSSGQGRRMMEALSGVTLATHDLAVSWRLCRRRGCVACARLGGGLSRAFAMRCGVGECYLHIADPDGYELSFAGLLSSSAVSRHSGR
jgi:hypothetical protein